MNYQDLWPAIQQDILGCLQADELIGTRLGVAVEPGDIGDMLTVKVDKAIGVGADGKVGVGCLVLPIEEAQDENANMPGGPLRLTIRVQFVENTILNRGPRGTQIPIRVYAAWAEKVLKLYTPVGLTQSLVPAEPVMHEFTSDTDANLRVGQLEFRASEADFKPFARVSRPQITVTGATNTGPNNHQLAANGPAIVTVSAPDADAGQIYYTLNGSHPYQANAQAVVYTGPVSVLLPCLFRARAFAHNKTGSDTAAANFWQ